MLFPSWLKTAINLGLFCTLLTITAVARDAEQGEAAAAGAGKPELLVQLGHPGGIISLDFSPDGRFVLTGGRSKIVQLWEAASGRQLRRFGGHGKDLGYAVFSPDGRSILTGGFSNTARLWSVADGREIRRFEGHAKWVTAVAFSPDGRHVLTGSGDGTARMWATATGEEQRRFEGHTRGINTVAFSPDGRLILTGSSDQTARLWEVTTGRELRRFEARAGSVSAVAFSPDGGSLLIGRIGDPSARLREVASGREIRRFAGHSNGVHTAVFSPDGRYLLTGSGGAKGARLWEVASGREIRLFQGDFRLRGIVGGVFSPDARWVLVASSGDPVARLWRVDDSRQVVRRFQSHSAIVEAVAFSPDGRRFLTGGEDRTPWLWTAATGQPSHRLQGHSDTVRTVAFSPDGRWVLTGSEDRTARLWSATTGEERRGFTGHSDAVKAVAFSPDGNYVLTGSSDKTARLWSAATGEERRRFTGHEKGVKAVAFSPDGRHVLTGGSDKTARLWSVDTGEERRRFTGHKSGINAVAFSPDGRSVLTGSDDRTARLWEAQTGRSLRRLTGHHGPITAVAFAPDGRRLLTGGWDLTARLWEAASGREIHRFEGHWSYIESLAFSPDGRYVLSGSADQTTRLWEVASGRELCRLVGFNNGNWAVVDGEGRFDASNGGDVEGLHWVVDWGEGPEYIELGQLKERYYEPGLLAKYLGFDQQPLRDVAALASERPEPYPALAIKPLDPADPELHIRLSNRGGGIGRVVVAINGKEVQADARGPGFDPEADSAELTLSIADHPYLMSGEDNLIEAWAYNAEGYLAGRGVALVYPVPDEAPVEPPTLWAILVGVSDYAGDRIDLRYAAKDAQDMAKALELGARRLFGAGRVRLTLLTTTVTEADRLPTRENLRKAFLAAEAARPRDILVVYLAGHGLGVGDDYYYLTQQAYTTDLTDPAIRRATAVSGTELTEWIKRIPALKQVMVLDTCEAGELAARLTTIRSLSADRIRAIDRLKDRTGFHILMGSAADAVSYEATRYAQGLLTYALLQGMKGAALKEDQYIDVSTLFQHAADSVPRLARHIGGIQRPQIIAPKGAASFDIGLLREEDRRRIALASPRPQLLRPRLQNPWALQDNLRLEVKIRQRLREASYAAYVRGRSAPLPVIYLDVDELPGAIRPSGIYTIEGDRVRVELGLFSNGEERLRLRITGSAGDPEALAEKIVEEMLTAMEN